MTRIKCLLFSLALCAAPHVAIAQQVMGSYYTILQDHDFFNSRGGRLTDLGAVLQQDRANFHRFGRRHDLDDGDPYFADPGLRAAIPELYRRGPRPAQYIIDAVRAGQAKYLYIQVIGNGSSISHLIVSEGAG